MPKERDEREHLSYIQKRVLDKLSRSGVKYKIAYYHADGAITIATEDTHKKFRITQGGETTEEISPLYTTPPTPKPEKVKEQLALWHKAEKSKPEPEKAKPGMVYEYLPETGPSLPKETMVTKWVPEKTVCQSRPECCKPRDIKAVFFDADQTIWTTGNVIASSITGKLCKIDDDTVLEISKNDNCPTESYANKSLGEIADEIKKGPSEKVPESKILTTIKLMPTFRETLDELNKRKIPVSIISLNTPGSVKRIIETFGLKDKFYEIRDSWENKGKVLSEISHKLDVCPCNTIFTDDRNEHTSEVSKVCGMALQIGAGKDVEQPIDILNWIK